MKKGIRTKVDTSILKKKLKLIYHYLSSQCNSSSVLVAQIIARALQNTSQCIVFYINEFA